MLSAASYFALEPSKSAMFINGLEVIGHLLRLVAFCREVERDIIIVFRL